MRNYIDGSVQDSSNSSAKHWSYCSLELSRQYDIWKPMVCGRFIDLVYDIGVVIECLRTKYCCVL